MRTFDLAPLYRSTVGFDRLFSMLDGAGFDSSAPSYPPYNIERTGENAYRISIAVAGFAENELTIESKENTLTVRGERDDICAGRRRLAQHALLFESKNPRSLAFNRDDRSGRRGRRRPPADPVTRGPGRPARGWS